MSNASSESLKAPEPKRKPGRPKSDPRRLNPSEKTIKGVISPMDKVPDVGEPVFAFVCYHGHYEWEVLKRVLGEGYATTWAYRDNMIVDPDIVQVIGWMPAVNVLQKEIDLLHERMDAETTDKSI